MLSDEHRRKEYDEMRSLFGSGAFRRSARAGGAARRARSTCPTCSAAADRAGGDRRFGGAGFSDLFSSIFSGGGAGRPGRAARTGAGTSRPR